MFISVIIITLNEAENLKSTIMSVKKSAQLGSDKSIPIEIIVSDGGSNDGTVNIAKSLADNVIIGPKGRYKQLNAGARASKGDVLLFLHADTILPKGALLRIYYNLKTTNAIGGGFRKYWNWSPKVKRASFLKFMSYWWQLVGNWLVDLFKNFPGDNAIFVRKNIFNKLNGFSQMWICEDFDFSSRMKRYGKQSILRRRTSKTEGHPSELQA